MLLIADLAAYLKDQHGVWRLIGFAALILGGWLVIRLTERVLRKAFQRLAAGADAQRTRRLEVLGRLAARAVRWAVYFIIVDITLALVFNFTGFSLTSLGIVSVALGFAVQPLVRDIAGGFFIILEGQYGVGDYVTIANLTGVVQDVSLRRTVLRGLGGEVYTVPHSQVDKTVNLSRGAAQVLVDVRVNYRDDLEKVMQVLREVCESVARQRRDLLVEPPVVLGVTDLGENAITVRILGRALPSQQWTLERELRLAVRIAFQREGFRAPVAQ